MEIFELIILILIICLFLLMELGGFPPQKLEPKTKAWGLIYRILSVILIFAVGGFMLMLALG